MIHSVLVAPFPSAEEANIALNSLRVDPEPRKSLASKQLSVDQNQLIAYVCIYTYVYVCTCMVTSAERNNWTFGLFVLIEYSFFLLKPHTYTL